MLKENLVPIEFRNIRVLTTKLLAQGYEVEENNIIRNFNNNKERYKEGKHFFKLTGNELKEFMSYMKNFHEAHKFSPELYLWTERGAFLHAKSLNNDKAWEIYEILMDNYFKVQDNLIENKKKEIELLELENIQKNQRILQEVEGRLGIFLNTAYELKNIQMDSDLNIPKKIILLAIQEYIGTHSIDTFRGIIYIFKDSLLLYFTQKFKIQAAKKIKKALSKFPFIYEPGKIHAYVDQNKKHYYAIDLDELIYAISVMGGWKR